MTFKVSVGIVLVLTVAAACAATWLVAGRSSSGRRSVADRLAQIALLGGATALLALLASSD